MKRLPILQLILLWLLSCSQLALADRITYFHYDATGTAIMATDEQANVLWKRAPTAYGETPEVHPAMKKYNHRMTVAGHYDDWETGLIYMGKRYYSPKLGRFLTPDPVGVHPHLPDTFNRYGYANNNPYKFVDPDGRASVEPLWKRSCSKIIEGGCGGGGMIGPVGRGRQVEVLEPSAVARKSPSGGSPALKGDIYHPDSVTARQKNWQNAYAGKGGMLGERGVQTASKTIWKGKGKERIDVENPNPGQRPGQIHYQDNEGGKYLYDPATNSFLNAPNSVNRLLEDSIFHDAIDKGIKKYLGE